MIDVDAVRVLIAKDQRLYRLGKIIFARADASVYLVPYGATGRYYYGRSGFSEEQIDHTFDFTEQEAATRAPKITIHESGQVHAYVGNSAKVGPLTIPPLTSYPAGHLATIQAVAIAGLAHHKKAPRSSGREVDWRVQADEGEDNCRLVIRLHSNQPETQRGLLSIQVQRPSLPRPLFLTLEAHAHDRLDGNGALGGSVALAGWDPTGASVLKDFLYIRGE